MGFEIRFPLNENLVDAEGTVAGDDSPDLLDVENPVAAMYFVRQERYRGGSAAEQILESSMVAGPFTGEEAEEFMGSGEIETVYLPVSRLPVEFNEIYLGVFRTLQYQDAHRDFRVPDEEETEGVERIDSGELEEKILGARQGIAETFPDLDGEKKLVARDEDVLAEFEYSDGYLPPVFSFRVLSEREEEIEKAFRRTGFEEVAREIEPYRQRYLEESVRQGLTSQEFPDGSFDIDAFLEDDEVII